MKKTLILCAAGIVGLASPLAFAEPTAAPAASETASSTVTAYVVNIKGAG